MNAHRSRSDFADTETQSVSFAESCLGYHFSMPKRITLREVFPDQDDEQVERIAEFLHSYCAVVWRIFERLEREHPEVIDELLKDRRMKGKVDSSKNTT